MLVLKSVSPSRQLEATVACNTPDNVRLVKLLLLVQVPHLLGLPATESIGRKIYLSGVERQQSYTSMQILNLQASRPPHSVLAGHHDMYQKDCLQWLTK